MMDITVFSGGSYNPPHEGHMGIGCYLNDALGCPNEIWYSFSTNRFKDPSQYAPLDKRIEMGRLLASHPDYAGRPFVMTDIERQLGTNRTYEILTELQKRFPHRKFIWAMGADNLAQFHTWDHHEAILENFCIGVLNRPPYTQQALTSVTAMTYPHLRIQSPLELAHAQNGWCFLDNPLIDMSSSHLLRRLRAGERNFGGAFQHVADYIWEHKLYGVGAAPADPAAARLPASDPPSPH